MFPLIIVFELRKWQYNGRMHWPKRCEYNNNGCDNTPLASRYINFFETISILAGDHLVVPIGVLHISLWHKKYNQRNGRKRTRIRTNEQYSLG